MNTSNKLRFNGFTGAGTSFLEAPQATLQPEIIADVCIVTTLSS